MSESEGGGGIPAAHHVQMRPTPRLLQCLLAACAAALFLGPIAFIDLLDRREEHIAADAIDTLHHGHWLVAFDHGMPRLKKPPLSRWLAAAALAVLPKTEFAVRLPFALATLATTWLIWRWATELTNPTGGVVAGFLFVTNFLVISESWVSSAESLLMAGVAGCLYFLWRASEQDALPHRSAWRLWASGLSLGAAMLAKGPIALVLAGFASLGFAFAGRREMLGLAMRPAFLLPAFAPLAAWGLAVWFAFPQAVDVWRHEMTHKVAGPDRRSMLLPKFVPMAAPWVAIAVAGVMMPAIGDHRHRRPGVWLAWSWCVLNLAMFSLWSGAREPYYLACMPAVAILGGLAWSTACEARAARPLRWLAKAQWCIAIGALAALPAAAWREARPQFPLAIGFAVAALAAVAWLGRRWRVEARLALPAAAIAIAIFGAVPEVIRRSQRLSHKEFCRRTAEIAQQRGLEVEFLSDLARREIDYMDAPDVTESIWFYLPAPPRSVGDLDHLAEALLRDARQGGDGARLLVVSPRQSQALAREGRFRVDRLVDEAEFAQWDTCLVEVRLK